MRLSVPQHRVLSEAAHDLYYLPSSVELVTVRSLERLGLLRVWSVYISDRNGRGYRIACATTIAGSLVLGRLRSEKRRERPRLRLVQGGAR